MAKVKFSGKVYKPAKFNEGFQEGTVEWELEKRKILRRQRFEDRQWAAKQAQQVLADEEAERRSLWGRLRAVWRWLKHRFS